MANALLTPTIIAREALRVLKNNLVFARTVHRDYSKEYKKVGSSVEIRRPINFTVTDGVTVSVQDVEEGKLTMTLDKHKHVAFGFSAVDLTLTIDQYSERYIKPAMIAIANQIDSDGLALAKSVHNWVGTPGQTVNSFDDFAKGPERLDNLSVPGDRRYAMLSPNDHWGLIGSQTALNDGKLIEDAYVRAKLPMLGNVQPLMGQNVYTLACGTRDNTTPLVKGASQASTYADVKTTMTQTLNTDGWDNSATLEDGMVFTIADVYAVNPVTGAALDFLAQWTVVGATTAHASGGTTALTISPAIITSGPYKTASAVPADGAAITVVGTASNNYRQNLVYHSNAFALATAPIVQLESFAWRGAETDPDTGLTITMHKSGDFVNLREDIRMDVLYGWKCIDPRLATRLSGTA